MYPLSTDRPTDRPLPWQLLRQKPARPSFLRSLIIAPKRKIWPGRASDQGEITTNIVRFIFEIASRNSPNPPPPLPLLLRSCARTYNQPSTLSLDHIAADGGRTLAAVFHCFQTQSSQTAQPAATLVLLQQRRWTRTFLLHASSSSSRPALLSPCFLCRHCYFPFETQLAR